MYVKEDPWGARRSPRERDRSSLIHSQFANRLFANGLDIGCGEGDLLASFDFLVKKTGIDISEIALKRAMTRFPNIAFIERDLRAIALPDHYDFISCLECLYYLQDDAEREKAVQAIAQLGTPDCTYLFSLVTRGDPKYRRYFNFDEASALLSRHFKIERAFPLTMRGRFAYRLLPQWARLALLSRTPMDSAYQCAFVCHR